LVNQLNARLLSIAERLESIERSVATQKSSPSICIQVGSGSSLRISEDAEQESDERMGFKSGK